MSDKMKNTNKNTNTNTNIKKNKFYGFIEVFINNYWQTILFILLIVLLLIILKYSQDKLDFPESKMIINWFGIIMIGNLLITYSIMMIYQKVKNQTGFEGAPGYQGKIGSSGENDYCDVCNVKVNKMEQVYELTPPQQPLMPEKIIVEKTKVKPKRMKPFSA
jgi:hypothetical protein